MCPLPHTETFIHNLIHRLWMRDRSGNCKLRVETSARYSSPDSGSPSFAVVMAR
jgi:hypothetical protein